MDEFQSKNESKSMPDAANYSEYQRILQQRENNPAAVGKGGDPLYKRIRASKDQLNELLDETTIVQDWSQREACNNAALAFLDNENLKEIYFEIKDGFADYGPILLMGFKSPQGVEIPRLKIYDSNGEVIEVLTGPLAIEELNKRAIAYRENKYECVPESEELSGVIEDYQGGFEEQ